MGQHQRAETCGLIAFVSCALIGVAGTFLYINHAPAFWQMAQRRFVACAAIVATCGVISFLAGCIHRYRGLPTKGNAMVMLRRIFEALALTVVYAATLFLASFMLFEVVNGMMGRTLFSEYAPALCAAVAGISGYVTFVQAELMDAKTLSSILVIFVISGVCTACFTTTDPNWYHNNFSQLGDSTSFAATMFNATLILGGICIIIISYFAITELITTYKITGMNAKSEYRILHTSYKTPSFKTRIILLSILLVLTGIVFIGIGTFRYTPHPILHNVFARSMPVVMLFLLAGLPWLAPQLSKAFFVISDLALGICAIVAVSWLMGDNTLTNVEALAALTYLGWFIGFSRQIAAIEADRIQKQLYHTEEVDQELLDVIVKDDKHHQLTTVMNDPENPVFDAQEQEAKEQILIDKEEEVLRQKGID